MAIGQVSDKAMLSQLPEPREIPWAAKNLYKRQYWVEEFYPRIIYTFSDVVVLVMNFSSLGEV